MPHFEYVAVTVDGKKIRAAVEGDNIKAARSRLKSQGLVVLEITEKKSHTSQVQKSTGLSFFSGVGSKDIALMTKQLSSLIKANIPLVEALNAVADQTENKKLSFVMSQVRQEVNEGIGLAKAMAAHPRIFDTIFISMIESGESSGTLSFVMGKLADLKEAQMRLQNKVVMATVYPALMMIVSFGLMLVIFTFVIPKMTKIFESSKKPIPLITQIVIKLSQVIVHWWFLFGIAGFIMVTVFMRYIRTPKGKGQWDSFKMKIPIMGNVLRLVAVTRFASTMATLLASGVPILASLQIAKNIVDNVPIANAIQLARDNITEGQSIADPLRRSGQFPPMMIHMVATGEKTGDLAEMLNSIATTYEEQVNASIASFTSLLEPLMIVVMGFVIGIVVLAVFLPLMEMMDITQR